MRIVYFTHSLISCWNHGNAHFLRGVLDELISRGHEVWAYEPRDSWSKTNLLADHGPDALDEYRAAYPRLRSRTYGPHDEVAAMVDGADLVIVHEWNSPELVAAIGRLRARGAGFLLLFHDTHHRAVSAPEEMRAYRLDAYDGVLCFGDALSEVYRRLGWGHRVWTWHEAADVRRFRPPEREHEREGLVWIGNWGDGERTRELKQFLFEPAAEAGLPLDIHGVRYPLAARQDLQMRGFRYQGWAANASVPRIAARYMATIHVPRRYYATILPGIPTIRVFEALACGIPLLCAPWTDCERLFRPGSDYLVARSGEEMARHLRELGKDPALRLSLVANGLESIHARHTCSHRVDELMAIVSRIASPLLQTGGMA